MGNISPLISPSVVLTSQQLLQPQEGGMGKDGKYISCCSSPLKAPLAGTTMLRSPSLAAEPVNTAWWLPEALGLLDGHTK